MRYLAFAFMLAGALIVAAPPASAQVPGPVQTRNPLYVGPAAGSTAVTGALVLDASANVTACPFVASGHIDVRGPLAALPNAAVFTTPNFRDDQASLAPLNLQTFSNGWVRVAGTTATSPIQEWQAPFTIAITHSPGTLSVAFGYTSAGRTVTLTMNSVAWTMSCPTPGKFAPH